MSKEAALAAITAATTQQPVTTEQDSVNTTETTATAPESPEVVKTQDSDRFASFARKEAELVKKTQAWKLEKEKTDAVLAKANQFEELRKTDPVAAMKLIGFSETEIFNFLAAQEKKELTPEEKAEETARRIAKEELDALRKEQADAQAKAQSEEDEKTLTAFKTSMGTYVTENKEKYPLCSHYGPAAIAQAYENVLQTIKDSKGEDIPTIEEAIADMEALYEYQFDEMSKVKAPPKYPNEAPSNAEAVKEKLERSKTVSAPGKLSAAPATKKTLTNAGTATTTGLSTPANETREQKRERLKAQLAAMQRRA